MKVSICFNLHPSELWSNQGGRRYICRHWVGQLGLDPLLYCNPEDFYYILIVLHACQFNQNTVGSYGANILSDWFKSTIWVYLFPLYTQWIMITLQNLSKCCVRLKSTEELLKQWDVLSPCWLLPVLKDCTVKGTLPDFHKTNLWVTPNGLVGL